MTQPSPLQPTRGHRLRLELHVIICFALAVLAGAPAAHAQSVSAGALSGSVRDEAGRPVAEADLSLLDDVTGLRRGRITPRDGGFTFELLLPGDYTLLVQRFGFRPVTYRRVPVRAGSRLRLDVVLREGGPESGVDSVAYPGVPAGGSHVALHGGGAADDYAELVDPRRIATGASALLANTDGTLDREGLPGRMGATAADGVTRWSPRHARLVAADLDGALFPLASARSLEMIPGSFDAEWPGSGGGVLSAFTIPGPRTLAGSAAISGGPDGQTGALVFGGPLVRDTAQFIIGVAGTRLNPELPSPWVDSTLGATAEGIARDSFNTDLSGYRANYKPTTTIVSGFGRFEWLVGVDHLLSLRASGSSATLDDPDLGPDQPPALGSRLTARDLSVGAALTSVIALRFGSEFRLSVDAGNHDYAAVPRTGTVFVDGGFTSGNTVLLPGEFKRTTFRISETGHMRLTVGSLKAGLQATFSTFEQTYADGRAGLFYFGDSTGFATQRGVFRQTVGTLPVARFKTFTIGFFAQALLRPTPVLSVLMGARVDRETAPAADIRYNSDWFRLTGIDNRIVPQSQLQVSPRAAFVWTLGAAHRWEVAGAAGLFAEPTDAAEFAEAITHGSGLSTRRGNGVFTSWPDAPDSTEAPVRGQTLTLLGPQYTPPRTGRVRFGLTGNMGGTIVRLHGAYRHTDYLPLRRDLNLPGSPGARDQYGRAIYGTLDKFGGVLAAVPGSNRRFTGFDEVSSVDPAAGSDYYGVTIGFERDATRGLSVLATYTYSRTTDNWYGARSAGSEAQLVPFADSTGRSVWADGRSDFDVPHRVVAGFVARVGSRARFAALYRWRSGYPFTPGFRDGVDANGDGSARNDPAFVTDTVTNAANVIAANSCLSGQLGGMAERNSCRDPSFGALDLRFAFRVGRLGSAPAEITLDVLDVVLSGADAMDHALYLVDPSRPLVTTPATGVTTVPLVANTNFGQVLVRRKTDPAFRVGVRVGL